MQQASLEPAMVGSVFSRLCPLGLRLFLLPFRVVAEIDFMLQKKIQELIDLVAFWYQKLSR
jgi:hypothetical protein